MSRLILSFLVYTVFALVLPVYAEEYKGSEMPPAGVLEKNYCKGDPTCKYVGKSEISANVHRLFFIQNNRFSYEIVMLYRLDTGLWVMDIQSGWKGVLIK